MSTLRISRTHFPVTALGPGLRLGIWVQGCTLACRGCMSQDTWNPVGGTEVEVDDLVVLWREAVGAGADGLTISGGEPLQQPAALRDLLRAVRRETGQDKDVLLFTGYDETELDEVRRGAADLVDVLVTGRYDVAAPTSRIWRGSANQRMVLRTELARRRYAEYVDHEPESPRLQVGPAGDGGVWIIGVPRRGALPGLTHDLRAMGLPPQDVTWRPSRDSTASGE
ncbi:4Fe-4S single cluster domain-containing protein [Lentzea californiensis]|uniref:4Fe-4S single cluster domain-containing protein n=1 Tax=Lentzea californiensis TaxID=438851 RepID=UPI002165BC2C|nr:4Fe-4S single cluster domain-containing protein [Lentzea californiensis]MCR3750257.1 anaerobic ribonucleoside-triphosphate reductase activating protein [Lentzea californiensis]